MTTTVITRTIAAGILAASLAYSANAATLGPELVDNGGFDTDAGWNLGYGWGISPGAPPAQGMAYHNEGSSGSIWRPVAHPVPAGATLRVTYTASGTAGASDPRHFVRVRGDSVTLSPIVSGDGTYTFDIIAPANVTRVDLFAVYGCACIFNDLSVRVLSP